jgi:carboxyl-terminal processing protease
LLVVLAAIGAALGPSLGGCVSADSPLGRVIGAITSDDYVLSREANREIQRFEEVYRTYLKDRADLKDGADDSRMALFRDVFARVRVEYVREIYDGQLIDAAIEGVRGIEPQPRPLSAVETMDRALDAMVVSLDPHSTYLNPEELRETQVSTKGKFGGLGIEVTMEDGLVKVVSPIEDTPAYHAGLKPGDLISHIDGAAIKGLTLLQAVKRMRGRPGTDIKLTVRRGARSPFDVTITRAVITVQSVRWRTEGDIGYIRVATFTVQVEDGVEEAVEGIRKKLGPRLKGLVLDLRSNPGGLLDQSVALSDAFLDEGDIVSIRGRGEGRERTFTAENGDLARRLPMVVLINGGSASASEIVAGALQDNGRAIIMGRRSFGKGSVQTIMPLPIEGALKLTTALYYSPAGRAIQALGVEPDIVITSEEAEPRRREADLPGALPSTERSPHREQKTVTETDCPEAGENGDRQLGCALVLLRAGSPEKFLASLGQRPSM